MKRVFQKVESGPQWVLISGERVSAIAIVAGNTKLEVVGLDQVPGFNFHLAVVFGWYHKCRSKVYDLQDPRARGTDQTFGRSHPRILEGGGG